MPTVDHGEIREFMGRIDERTKDILEQLKNGKSRMDAIELRQLNAPCRTNSEKIKQLERWTYGMITAGILLVGKWAWAFLTGGK